MTMSGRKAKLLTGALLLSVCLNVAAAAAMGGRLFHGERPHGGAAARLLKGAPDAARPVLRDKIVAHESDLSQQAEAVRAARRDIARLMQADGQDPAAIQAAFAELRRRSDDVQQTAHAIFIEAWRDLPAEARAQWAKMWEGKR